MEPMEKWESDLREKLEAEIPEGIYSIVIDGRKYLTGRGGIIDQIVEEEKAKKYPKDDENKFVDIP